MTDPVEEPISEGFNCSILATTKLSERTLLLGCVSYICSFDVQTKKFSVLGKSRLILGNLISQNHMLLVGNKFVAFLNGEPLKVFVLSQIDPKKKSSQQLVEWQPSSKVRHKLVEKYASMYRNFAAQGNMVYFLRLDSPKDKKRGKIVRVNLDTFEEVVLDKLADNIADFLVDENQTITYLTSQGELRQENPDNSSIPKTCVNLNYIPSATHQCQSLCKISSSDHLCTSYVSSKEGNKFSWVSGGSVMLTQTVPIPEITGMWLNERTYESGDCAKGS